MADRYFKFLADGKAPVLGSEFVPANLIIALFRSPDTDEVLGGLVVHESTQLDAFPGQHLTIILGDGAFLGAVVTASGYTDDE